MPADLIVNPFLQFRPFLDPESNFVLTAPKPGEGTIEFTVSQAEHPNIFEVFTDLSQTQFSFLEADKDLTPTECDLLLRKGVLIEKETRLEKPLFECDLENIAEYPNEIDVAQLIVNTTFQFERHDLTSFASLSQMAHLSPFRPTAWIANSVTQVPSGYWLSPGDAEIVEQFTAGGSPKTTITDRLLRKLTAARILGTADGFENETANWLRLVEKAKQDFAADKYSVVRGLFPPEQMAAMRSYYRRYVDNGFMPFGDTQVPRRFRQHNEPFASFLHGKFSKLVSRIVGEAVKPSYAYAASYKGGAVLPPHTDREQCEFSISFQVDYEPEPPQHVSPWAIYVEPIPESCTPGPGGLSFTWDELAQRSVLKPSGVHLASGDGLFYKGRHLIHYRDALPAGHRSTSLFFHFVPADFDGTLN